MAEYRIIYYDSSSNMNSCKFLYPNSSVFLYYTTSNQNLELKICIHGLPNPPGLPRTDFEGNYRILERRPDIGAYEQYGHKQ